MQIKPIVLYALQSELTQAAEAFIVNSGGEPWKRLEDSMWALQYARQRSEAELQELTEKWQVKHFPELFTLAAKSHAKASQTITEIPKKAGN